jgi:two-component sensor histidine kinase
LEGPVSSAENPRAEQTADLRLLFHRLNNQLGIILSHAELLEAKTTDEMNRSRAAQVIASALDALSTVKEIRRLTPEPTPTSSGQGSATDRQ